MKYIKELNIDFNNWENYDTGDFDKLDKFFKQTEYSECGRYYLYMLLINKNSLSYIEQYLKYNKLKIIWASGDELIKLSKFYFHDEFTKQLNLTIRKDDHRIYFNFNNGCYKIIDFRY